jgi:hypothetical protein
VFYASSQLHTDYVLSAPSFVCAPSGAQLRISSSTHSDLTIRANTERSWDYTGGMASAAKGGGAEEYQRARDGEAHYTGQLGRI